MEIDRFVGTSFQEAIWIEFGRSKGRDRQDQEHNNAKSFKAICVYPLQADFRSGSKGANNAAHCDRGRMRQRANDNAVPMHGSAQVNRDFKQPLSHYC